MLYDEARIQALENEVHKLRQENARLLKELSRIVWTFRSLLQE